MAARRALLLYAAATSGCWALPLLDPPQRSAETRPGTRSTYAYAAWSGPIAARTCSHDSTPLPIPLVSKAASAATMTCALVERVRIYQLPAGIFEIGEQLLVPANTSLVGVSSPNDMANPTRSPDWG